MLNIKTLNLTNSEFLINSRLKNYLISNSSQLESLFIKQKQLNFLIRSTMEVTLYGYLNNYKEYKLVTYSFNTYDTISNIPVKLIVVLCQ